MRNRAVAVAALAGLLSSGGASLTAQPASAMSQPFLHVSLESPTVPATADVSGGCPPLVNDSETFQPPDSGTLDFPAAGVSGQRIPLDSNGEFSASYPLPATTLPGTHPVTLTCPETSVGAASRVTEDLTVEPPPTGPEPSPTLELDRSSAATGEEVTATGTCPRTTQETPLHLDRQPLGTATVDSSTGALEPFTFEVPGVGRGPHRVMTGCGGSQVLTVVPPQPPPPPPSSPSTPATRPAPTTTTPGATTRPGETTTSGGTTRGGTAAPAPSTPPATVHVAGIPGSTGRPPQPPTVTSTPQGLRIVVPDLTGLTPTEARGALGDQLALANPASGEGRVVRQSPLPGTLVRPASVVRVVLGRAPVGHPSALWLLVGLLVSASLAALTVFRRGYRRRKRERRWLDSHVRTEVHRDGPELSDVPHQRLPGLDARIEVRRDPIRSELQEVSRVRD